MWAIGWLALAAQAQVNDEPQVADRLVAVVGGSTVVTSFDIALEQAIAQRDRSVLPFWDHADVAEVLIDAALLRIASADVVLYEPSPEDIRARADAFRSTFATPAEWTDFSTRWGLDDATLGVLARRRLVVERFLQRNLKSAPADREAWLAETHALVAALESRIPVRRITPSSP